MLPYWLLFLFFALGALLGSRDPVRPLAAGAPGAAIDPDPMSSEQAGPGGVRVLFVGGMLLMLVMIGLRWKVGGDWLTYIEIFERIGSVPFAQQLSNRELGFVALNALVDWLGGGVVTVNFLSAIPFVVGLYRLARLQPLPWLCVVVAIPYLVIVVAMGYTRQAVAIGFLMMGIAAVIRGAGVLRFGAYVLMATLFHSTAVILLPLMLFVFPTSRALNIVMVVAITYALYTLFLQEGVDRFTRNYLEARYSSSGAAIRIAQLTVAAVLFFAVGARTLGFDEKERRIWRNQAAVALAMVPLLLVSSSSTFVDRISLYLLPLQLVVLGRVPLWMQPPVLARLLVIAYSAGVLFVWLNFAAHAFAWLPYQNALFVDDGGLR